MNHKSHNDISPPWWQPQLSGTHLLATTTLTRTIKNDAAAARSSLPQGFAGTQRSATSVSAAVALAFFFYAQKISQAQQPLMHYAFVMHLYRVVCRYINNSRRPGRIDILKGGWWKHCKLVGHSCSPQSNVSYIYSYTQTWGYINVYRQTCMSIYILPHMCIHIYYIHRCA